MTNELYDKLKKKIEDGKITKEDIENAKKSRYFNINDKGDDGWTLLHWALFDNRIEEMKLLLDCGADVDAQDDNGWTVCMNAARMGNIEALRVFKERNPCIDIKDKQGMTACIHAAAYNQIEALKVLVNEMGANIDLQDNNCMTASIHVARWHKKETLFALVELGANLSIRDNEGKTVFDFIDKDTKKKVIELRRKYEAAHSEEPKMADELAKIYLIPQEEIAVRGVGKSKIGDKARHHAGKENARPSMS